MQYPARSSWLRYVSAMVAVALMTGIRSALHPIMGERQSFVFFYFAVLFTAWYGGFGPSVVAIILSCLSATYFFLVPYYSLHVRNPGDLLSMGMFFAVSSAIVAFSEANRAAHRRLEREVADRKNAERAVKESEDRFKQLFNTMPQIVWTAEPEGSVLYFNGRWYEYTGLTPDESLSHEGWRVVVHPDDSKSFEEVRISALSKYGMFEAEVRLRDRQGKYHWHLIRSVPVSDDSGRVLRRFGTATDIHDRKLAEYELLEADRRKDVFLAMLAHELRNPLAPIFNAVSIMAITEDDPDTQRWSRDLIERQVRHLAKLVDDLLDVSRITQGKIKLTKSPLPVSTFINAAVESSRPLIDSGHHRLDVSMSKETLRVEGDLTRLTQIVLNLLNNAAKFSPEGGHIHLSACQDGSQVAIRVRDEGEGIPRDMLGRVFDLFTQVNHSIDRSQGGLGVGLTLVRRLAEMHGGSIEVQSDGPGKGSEFLVRLPLISPETASSESQKVTTGGNNKSGCSRRILIVDDSPQFVSSLAELLTLLGHDIETAYDGLAAGEKALAFNPDFVFLDIGMPRMDGFEVARRLRAEPLLGGVSIVALTGYGSESDRKRSKESGFDHHLVKPVELDALLAILERTTQVGSSGEPSVH